MPDDERRLAWRAMLLFAVIAAVIGADLVGDWGQGAGASHIALEAAVMVLAMVGLGLGAKRLLVAQRTAQQLRGEAEALRGALEKTRQEAAHWRKETAELLEGLGAAIDRQFERWQLSPAEREVGLLLLKGLSHHEVARVRGTSERTVRQQARALYKKSGLSGRADLAAYFLEDLLLPRQRSSTH
jgi:DNA-binding CsgD family transcriptional regulator